MFRLGLNLKLGRSTQSGEAEYVPQTITVNFPQYIVTATYTPPTVSVIELTAPSQPVISATPGNTEVDIALTSGGTPADSYDVKWGIIPGVRSNTITGVTLPYTHTGRTNAITYYYSLVAVNAAGSTESAEVSATPEAASAYLETFETWNGTFPAGYGADVDFQWTGDVGELTTPAYAGSYAAKFSVVKVEAYEVISVSTVVTFPMITIATPLSLYAKKTVVGSDATVSVVISDAQTWVSGGTYELDETVERLTVIYRCIQAHTGHSTLPGSDTSYWVAESVLVADASIASSYALETATLNKGVTAINFPVAIGENEEESGSVDLYIDNLQIGE